MEKRELLSRVQDIFRDVFGIENLEIAETTNASDIEDWDSLMHISILAAVQDEFGVVFNMDEITNMKNVGDIITAIGEKM